MTNSKNVLKVDFGQNRDVEEEIERAIDAVTLDRAIVIHGDVYLNTAVQSKSESTDDREGLFRLTVEVDREMERSVLYRVVLMIELIAFILITRSIALYFLG